MRWLGLVLLACACEAVPMPVQHAPSNSKTAIVVGSGFAGLGAALTLQQKGFSVTVLEARDRYGGRSFSENTTFGEWVEYGAEWIHGVKNNPVFALASKYNCSSMKTNYDDVAVYDENGTKITKKFMDHVDKDLKKLYKEIDYCSYSSTDISLEEGVQRAMTKLGLSQHQMERYRFELESEIVDDYAAPLSNLSCWNWDCDDALHGGDYLLNDGGYSTIIDGLVRDIGPTNIHLNSTVTSVDHSDLHGVIVTTSDGQRWPASYAVVTVPLGVLKAGHIIFNPPLDTKRAKSIQQLAMGLYDKLHLQFNSSAAWGFDHKDGFEYFANGGPDPRGYGFTKDYGKWPGILNQYVFNKEKNILTFFVSGDFAREMEALPTQQIVDSAMGVLRVIFPSIPDPIQALFTRWAMDPFSYGSYSHIPPGATAKTMDALLGTESHLLLAGEHCTHHRFAQTTGAWETGLSAAHAIHALDAGEVTVEGVATYRTEEHTANSKRWGAYMGAKTVDNGLWGRKRGGKAWASALSAVAQHTEEVE